MKFQVFKDGSTAKEMDLGGTYLFGSDGIPLRRGQVTFENGILNCDKGNIETAGMAILWPVRGYGKIMLPTTCLPERDRPYILNVELARGKLMQIVNNCEEWSLFGNNSLGLVYKDARQLFTRALQNISDPPKAAKLADDALRKAIKFSDHFTLKQADLMLKHRVNNRSISRAALGCIVDPKQVGKEEYIKTMQEIAGCAYVPVNWAEIEKSRGQYDFAKLDNCIKALIHKRFMLTVGPLLQFDKQHIPQWLIGQKASFEKIRECAYRFVYEMVERYSSVIKNWVVAGGFNCKNYFGFNFEQILEMTRAACMSAKDGDARARKIIEIHDPWGQYYATTQGTIPPLVYMDMVIQSGVNFDVFALQMDLSSTKRDMMQVSSLLDYMAPVAKTFYITSLNVPRGYANEHSQEQINSQQGQWLECLYRISLSKPLVDTVIYSLLADEPENAAGHSGLITEKLEPKDAFLRLRKLRKIICTK